MALDVMSMIARLGIDKSEYEKGMKDAETGFKNFGSNLKKGVQNVAKIAAGAAAAGAAAFGAVTAAVVKGTGEVAAFGDNIDKASQKLGISAKAYQEWDAVLQHSGTSIDSMGIGMKTLATKAAEGSDAFKALGISQKEAARMSREDLFARTITALQGVQNANQRAQLAQELFGKSAMELGPLLNTSAKDTQAMKDRVNELGGVLSDEAVKASAAYQDSLQDMTTAMDGMKRGLFASFLPSLTSVMDGITEIFAGGKGKAQITRGVRQLIDTMSTELPRLLRNGLKIGTAVGRAVISAIPETVRRIRTAAGNLFNNLKNLLLTNGVQKLSVMLNQFITGGTDKAFGPAQRIIQYRLTALFENIIKAVKNVINNGRSVIEALVDLWTTFIEPIFQEALSFILDKVLPVANSAWELINKGLSAIPSIIGDVVNAIKDGDWWKAGSIIWDSIKSGFNAVKGWLLKLVLGDDYTPESGWSDAGAKIWNAIKKGFAVVNDWLIKLLMGDDWKPESGWGDVGSKIWTSIKAGFAVVNGWLLKLVLGDDYTPEAGWGTVGSKIWTAIKDGFAAVNDWLIKLVMGDEWTPEAGWSSAGEKIWQSIKDGFAVANDWLIKLLLGEGEYTPDATWSTVGEKIWGKIVGGLSSAVDWLKNLFDGWTEKLTDGSIDFASIGTTIGSTVWGAIKDAFNTVVSWFKNLFGGESDDDQNSVKGAIYSIDWTGLGTSIFGFIGAAFDGIVATFTGYFQSALDAIKELDWAGLGDAMWNAITGAFDTIASWFKETFRGPINTVIDYINEMITNFENAFNRVIDGINYLLGTNFERKVFDRVQKIYNTVFGTTPVYGGGGGTSGGGAGRRDIRGYAGGGILRNGDVGVVGEYQPELLQMINGKAVVTPLNTGRFPGGGGQEVVVPRNDSRQLTVILELDRQQMGKAVYRLNNEETQRVGVKLAKGVAY